MYQSPHFSLGAVRLKIIDLECGRQPMISADGACALAFNGELFNHTELRRELERRGHQFRSRCDTEVVLNAFLEWDSACFRRFRGMFAAAFWQEKRQRLVLARDRMGIKPLYYSLQGGQIFFGSELKALFENPEIPRQISQSALRFYLSLNYVPGPLTLANNIYKLEPGTWLEWHAGNARREAYWRNVMGPRPQRIEEAAEELDQLLSNAVREQLEADVPAGIWLSGGLDSSTLLHYAARNGNPPRTFSIAFRGQACDESRYYLPLAAHYGSRHEEFDLRSDLDLTSTTHELSQYLDEPNADAGAVPVWFLSKMSARSVRVALSGEGADEIFGGYQTYLADAYARIARRLPLSLRKGALAAASRLPVSDRKIGLEYRIKRFLAGALLPADEAHFFWNGTFSESELQLLGIVSPAGLLRSLIAVLPSAPGAGDLNRYLFADQHYYLPDNILAKCDRMSMAHSLEVRPPFLDHRLVEFAARLPREFKVRGGQTKVLLRYLMRNQLPKTAVNPAKEGLDIPAHAWLRGPLRDLVLQTLSQKNIEDAGLLPYSSVSALIARHLQRRENLGYHLWGLLTLHLWIRRWNIQTTSEAAGERWQAVATTAGKLF